MPDVAIVGAGIMGLATARALTGAGYDVVVYEQFDAGHARGSSHGRSRIFRLAYAEPEWVQLAREALSGWRELEAETGQRLLELNGLIEIVSDVRDSSAAALETCGVAWSRLDRDEVERRFPLRLPPGSFAMFQPEAGIVRADRALAAFARGIDVRYGARVDSLADVDGGAVTRKVYATPYQWPSHTYWPATKPDAHAHWKLNPPSWPVTSTTSPMK